MGVYAVGEVFIGTSEVDGIVNRKKFTMGRIAGLGTSGDGGIMGVETDVNN